MTPSEVINTAGQMVAPLLPLLGPAAPFVSALLGIGGALAAAGESWQRGVQLVYDVLETWRREDESGRAHMQAAWSERIARSLADYRVAAHHLVPQARDTPSIYDDPNDDERSELDSERRR